MERFIVKHSASEDRPIIKGNGFDGIDLGETRQEAEEFIGRVNDLIDACKAIDTFFVFFESNIPPHLGGGARQALMMVREALRPKLSIK